MRFNDGWVPYEERGAWLLQADCAVAAHRDHLETRFSHRTRLLDCLWAGLPIVCTRGDELAERIARDGLGEAVPPADPAALAAALARVLDRGRGRLRGPRSPPRRRNCAGHGWRSRWPRWSAAEGRPSRSARGPAAAARARPRCGRGTPPTWSAKTALNAIGLRDWPRVR